MIMSYELQIGNYNFCHQKYANFKSIMSSRGTECVGFY